MHRSFCVNNVTVNSTLFVFPIGNVFLSSEPKSIPNSTFVSGSFNAVTVFSSCVKYMSSSIFAFAYNDKLFIYFASSSYFTILSTINVIFPPFTGLLILIDFIFFKFSCSLSSPSSSFFSLLYVIVLIAFPSLSNTVIVPSSPSMFLNSSTDIFIVL